MTIRDEAKQLVKNNHIDEPEEPEPDEIEIAIPATRAINRWSIGDLLDADFPEPRWAIPGLIPEGLTIFGGRPKVGKSWMMLQAAWAVGTGGRFLDQEVEQGHVLYIALEDSGRRLQERIRDMGIGRDALITFVNRWRPLHQDGMNDLFLELERTDYRMVIIDTLTRALPGIDVKRDGGVVGRIFDELQRLAMTKTIALELIDHTRKPSGYAADPVDDILHATEKTAIADCILALYKQQGKPGAQLMGRGRDLEDVDYSMVWDQPTRCWQLDSPDLTENFDDILDALGVLGKAQVGEIAKSTGQNQGNVYKRLMRLAELEKVVREKIGSKVYYEKA